MALQFIYGRAGSGKTAHVLEQVAQTVEAGRRAILLVPEQYTHIAERKVLHRIGKISAEGAEVLSFDRLAQRAAKELGAAARRRLSVTGKSIVIADILSNQKLEYFSGMERQPGFVDTCMGLIGEFKKYGVSPEELERAAEGKNARFSAKLRDLASVYAAYQAQLCQHWLDADDALAQLAGYIRTSGVYAGMTVLLDEYSSFIPQEMEVIAALTEVCDTVALTLCTDSLSSADPLFQPTVTTAQKLKRLCTERGIATAQPVHLHGSGGGHPELVHLERQLYTYPVRPYDKPCEAIEIAAAANPYDEVSRVARQMVALCRDHGYRWREMGVICSDLAQYGRLVKSVFETFDIPCFLDERVPVLDHHLILFALGALDIYLDEYRFDTVFGFLKAGYTTICPDDLFLLENYVMHTKIRKTAWVSDEKWKYLLDRYPNGGQAVLERINSVRDAFIQPLKKLHDAIKGRHSVREVTVRLYEYFVEIGLPHTIEQYLEQFRAQGQNARAKEYEKIWSVLVSVLDELTEVLGDKTVNVREYRNLLAVALGQHSMGLIPTSLDEVVVGNVERTKLSGVRALFVLGVNDGLFPIGGAAEDVLTDAEKDLLAADGMELSTNSRVRAFLDQFYIYSTFTLPRERLYLSYAGADSAFHTLRPSFVIARLKKVFPHLEVRGGMLEDLSDEGQLALVTRPKPTAERLTEALTAYRAGQPVSPVWLDVYRQMGEAYAAQLEQYAVYTNQAGQLDAQLVQQVLGDPFYITVSRLQKYRGCQYSYFLEYMLKLKEREEFRIRAVDTGSLVHHILERICVHLQAAGIAFADVDDAELKAQIDRHIDAYIAELTQRTNALTKRELYLVRRLRSAVELCFGMLKNHFAQSKFVPMGYEIKFGDTGMGAISIPLSGGRTAKLTGVIDRADKYETENGTFVRVIDYKTGSKTFRLDDVFYGLDIQLMVYLDALVQSDARYQYGGALYFKIDDPIYAADCRVTEAEARAKIENALKMKGLLLDDEQVLAATDPVTANRAKTASFSNFKALSLHLQKTVQQLCNALSAGDIAIRPYRKSDFSPCEYCPYGGVCSFDPLQKGNRYEFLPVVKDDAVWAQIGGDTHVDSPAAERD